MKLPENTVPNVKGMGARDAVYLLEKMGIKIKITGRGLVSSQSVKAGSRISNGMKITLNLSS